MFLLLQIALSLVLCPFNIVLSDGNNVRYCDDEFGCPDPASTCNAGSSSKKICICFKSQKPANADGVCEVDEKTTVATTKTVEMITTRASTTSSTLPTDPSPQPENQPPPTQALPINIVYGRVGENASVPCYIYALSVYPDGIFTTTWKKETMFLANAQVGVDGKLAVNYLDEELQKKFTVVEDYSLVVRSLGIKDSANFTCSVIKFKSTKQEEYDGRYKNTTYLLVQDVPSPPGRPTIIEKTSRRALIKWTPSDTDNNSPIEYYAVNVMNKDNIKVKEVSVMTSKSSAIPSAALTGLRPYTAYKITINAVNEIGMSIPSLTSDLFFTDPEAPESEPLDLRATSNLSSRIHLSWQAPPPETHHGTLQGFKIEYESLRTNIHQIITVEDPQKTEVTVYGLEPFEEYEVSVLAFNNVGDGPAARTLIRTAEGIPGPPLMIHSNTPPQSTSFYANWLAPDKVNGRIISYELLWKHGNVNKTKIISKYLTNPMQAHVNGLDPFTQYKVQVRAITGGGKGQYSDVYPVYTDVAGPGPPVIRNLSVIGTDSIYLSWDPPSKFYRTIDNYFIQIRELSSNLQQTRALKDNDVETIVTGLPTNKEYTLKVAGVTKSLHSPLQYIGVFSEPRQFGLSELEGNSSWNDSESVVRFLFPTLRPPPENHEPVIRDPSAIGEAEETVANAGIIAGVVCAVLFVLLAVLGFIGCRSLTCQKYYQAAYNYLAVPTNNNASPPSTVIVADVSEEKAYSALRQDIEKTFPPIKKEDFLQHVQTLHADSDVGFSHEFEEVNKLTSVEIKADVCMYPENKQKNRYVNIQAYDHSRVVLQRPLQVRQRQSDYINANYVDGYKKPRAYIATQGPLPHTFADFWRMVWEQNSVVIVMITKLIERTRRKCDQYWPEDGIETYGPIQVKHVNTFSRAHYTVRIFSLKNVKLKKQFSERIVHQFHYTEWPDHGVPDFTLPVLKFVQKSASLNPQKAGPIVVHCSAGVGRTGTYILIDSMIEQIKDTGTINIPAFLLEIRKQRNFLVQTEDQYMLIHDALAEYLLCPMTEIKQTDVKMYVEKLSETPLDIMPSLLQNIFLIVTAYKPRESDKSCALLPLIIDKNRNLDLIPLYPKRVKLPFLPGVEGSDYINASYLQGFNSTDEFILTQHPLPATVRDFWRMVWDNNSSVIVLLSSVDEQEFPKFWPEEENGNDLDNSNFKLVFQETEVGSQYTLHTFLLESTQDDYVLMTQIVACPNWPRSDLPLHSSFNLVERVKELQSQKDSGPIIVVDRFGGVEGAKFCILSALLDQLNHDKTIDVYHLCKLYHKKRPGVIGSPEDYLFVFQAISSFIQDQYDKETASISHHLHLRSSAKKNGSLPKSPTLQSKVETNV